KPGFDSDEILRRARRVLISVPRAYREISRKMIMANGFPVASSRLNRPFRMVTVFEDAKVVQALDAPSAVEPNVLALSDHVRAEQVELDFPDDLDDARLTGLAGREVAGFLGLAGAGPVRAVAGEGARGEDLEQERGECEIGLLRGKKPRRCPSRRPGHAGS